MAKFYANWPKDAPINVVVRFKPKPEDPNNIAGYMNMHAYRKLVDGRVLKDVVPFPNQFTEETINNYTCELGDAKDFYVTVDDAYYFFDAVTCEFKGSIAKFYGEMVEGSIEDGMVFVSQTHVCAFDPVTLKMLWRRKLNLKELKYAQKPTETTENC